MTNLKYLILLCFIGALFLSSCSRNSPAIPRGEQGEQGLEGAQGEQGVPGADGSTIFNGKGSPSKDLGKNGDYYLDEKNSNLYGQKTDEGWGTPLDLKGAKGENGNPGKNGENGKNGKDGSRIWSGSSKPTDADDGKEGDYYWDSSTNTLYGPKTSAGWGSGVVLKGEKGEPGTANVMYSDWMKFDWDNSSFTMKIDCPISADFFDKGGIILYYLMVHGYNDYGGIMFTSLYSLPSAISSGDLGDFYGSTYNFDISYEGNAASTYIFIGGNQRGWRVYTIGFSTG